MTILERAERLRSLAVTSKDLDALKTQEEALQTRVTAVMGWITEVRRLVPAVRCLTEAARPPSSIDVLPGISRSIRAVLRTHPDPTKLGRSNAADAAAMWDQTPRTITSVETRLLGEWQDHLQGLIPRIDQSVVRVLAGANAGLVETKLNRLLRETHELSTRLPSDAECIRASQATREIADALHQVGLDSLPPDVQTFVAAAIERTATLEMLTPDVLEELRARELDTKLRLGF